MAGVTCLIAATTPLRSPPAWFPKARREAGVRPPRRKTSDGTQRAMGAAGGRGGEPGLGRLDRGRGRRRFGCVPGDRSSQCSRGASHQPPGPSLPAPYSFHLRWAAALILLGIALVQNHHIAQLAEQPRPDELSQGALRTLADVVQERLEATRRQDYDVLSTRFQDKLEQCGRKSGRITPIG